MLSGAHPVYLDSSVNRKYGIFGPIPKKTLIKVVNRGKVLQTFAKSRDRDAPLPRIRGAKLIDMSVWKFPRVGSRIKFLDRIETVYTTKDIIRIFDIDKTTVYKWQKSGLLPEPLFTRQNKYDKTMRYYVRPQLAVAAKVVNDLLAAP